MNKLEYKTFLADINNDGKQTVEYVNILDKVLVSNSLIPTNSNTNKHKYLVMIVGERPNSYHNGKAFVMDFATGVEREIITPNKGKTFLIEPSDIIEMVNP
jgi:hypothetical protein